MRSLSIVINGTPKRTVLSKIFDVFIYTLIVLNFAVISIESFEDLNSHFTTAFKILEYFSVTIFTIEYLLRLLTAKYIFPDSKYPVLKYIFSFYGLVDLFAILPFYLPFLITVDLREIRIIRLLRLLRVLKLARVSHSFNLIGDVFKSVKSELALTMIVTFSLLFLASTLMYHVEHDAQPDAFSNVFHSMWWAVATFTTVGYGDMYPITPLGKFLSGVIALLGIGIVALPTSILSSAFIREFHLSEDEKEEKEFKYCPHCGEKLQ